MTSWHRSQTDLLRTAGFVEIDEEDATEEYLRIRRITIEARERYAEEFRKAEGEMQFADDQRGKREELAAIEGGLLRRSLLVAERPR